MPYVSLLGRWIVLVLLPCVACVATHAQTSAPPAPAAEATTWTPKWEHWYVLEMAGGKAGWTREIVSETPTHYRTELKTKLTVSRGPTELEVTMTNEFVETRAGEPVRLTFVQDLSLQRMDVTWLFGEEHVEVITKQGGREIRKQVPLPDEPWLTPMAARRYWLERREAGATQISYAAIEPDHGLDPVTTWHELIGEEDLVVNGRPLRATVWKSTNSAINMPATTKVSEDGHTLFQEAALPFGKIVTRLSTREEALEASGMPAPELMVNLFVRADRPIERPRATTRSVLRLSVREGTMPEIPSTGAQRAERTGDGQVVQLHVSLDDPVPATASETADAAYLEPSALADAGDALIAKLAAGACRGVSEDPYERALALHGFVHRHISEKSLDTAFASASETARMRKGDCSEHGVLLCALLRAQGIPARVATGLIYADAIAGERDIFGWHMWTQALIDGAWIDLDATLAERFDAAHVLTSTSSLADGLGSTDMAGLMQLMGNLEIGVESVSYD